MKPAAIVILITVLSLASGYLFTHIIPPLSGEDGGDFTQLRIQVDELSRQVRSLSEAQRDLEKGAYAVAADRTLDRALELDPNHWDARFTKASSLTFYPPIMGKQGEALRHFEILLEQQKALPPDPTHSQTYLFLGNLHQQMGDYQKASRIWKDGLALFPENSDLAKQLENAMNK